MHLVVAPDGTARDLRRDDRPGRAWPPRPSPAPATSSRTPKAAGTPDLRPVDGPVLGPFDRRSEALEAEVAWLEAHWLTPPS